MMNVDPSLHTVASSPPPSVTIQSVFPSRSISSSASRD